MSGCAQTASLRQDNSQAQSDSSDASALLTDAVQIVETQPSQERALDRFGVKVLAKDFDIPIRVNSQVEKWVDYFTGRGRANFEVYLKRSELFIPYLQQILKENDMPSDLVYLAMIESGFNNHAKSRAKAVGPWQFMKFTGKRYGLQINWWVDERRDLKKSTEAAIRYLSTLYGMFGHWELAASAYNAGEMKVARAIERFGTKDYWAIARHRFLSAETRNYVPKMIAAAIISKNRKNFGFEERYPHVPGEATTDDKEVAPLPSTVSENEAEPTEEEEGVIDLLNPEAAEVADASEPEPEPDPVPDEIQAIPTPIVNKKGQLDSDRLIEVEIPTPADLFAVARAAGVTYLQVKAMNPEILRWVTPPTGEHYKIKLPESVRKRFVETYLHPAFPREVRFLKYKVKSGDTVQKVARRFGISVDGILDLNRISKGTYLAHGREIALPLPSDRSRSLATLEVVDAPERKVRKRFTRIDMEARRNARAR